MEAKVMEIDQLDAIIRRLINEYLNGDRGYEYVLLLTMKMSERCLANTALENMRAAVAADRGNTHQQQD